MTTDRRDDDCWQPEASGDDARNDERARSNAEREERVTFGALFERGPGTVTNDDVTTALRAIRSGEEE